MHWSNVVVFSGFSYMYVQSSWPAVCRGCLFDCATIVYVNMLDD